MLQERIVVKETMAITMIDPINVANTSFEGSHLLAKLQKIVICARMFESKDERRSPLLHVSAFDLNNRDDYDQVRQDYEEVRSCIKEEGFERLSGHMGKLVQPRTKGPGHGSKSRSFYARKEFVTKMLGLE